MKTLSLHLQEYLSFAQSLFYSPVTLRIRRFALLRFIRWLEETHGIDMPDRLRPEHLKQWLECLRQKKTGRLHSCIAPRTINSNLADVRSFLNYLIQHNHLQSRLLESLPFVKEPFRLPHSVLDHDRVRALLETVDTTKPFGYRDRAILELLYSSGLRSSEILRLDVNDLQLEKGLALIHGKGNKERMVPFGKTALRFLETYLKAIRPYLMKHPDEKALFLNHHGHRISYDNLRHLLRRYLPLCPLPVHTTLHTFRRSCASELVRNNAPLYHVKELLGHERLDTLQHYVRLHANDLRKTIARYHPREKDHL